jgi:hypothetical protein
MGIKISKDHLHPSVIESITSLIGDLSLLETTAKGNAVEAINELLANGGNKEELEALIAEIAEGKELIANAVGEPLTAEESFDEMSNDINSLLSAFKTNMMNNGITVESSDRFKQLIDKIATMVEEGSGKGVQFYSTTQSLTINGSDYFNGELTYGNCYTKYTKIKDLPFEPTIMIVAKDYQYWTLFVNSTLGLTNIPFAIMFQPNVYGECMEQGGNVASFEGTINYSNFKFPLTSSINATTANYSIMAFGVGEEDTTLRDSLASILENKGVDVTEEDDMASLISKVDGIGGGLDIISATELPATGKEGQICVLNNVDDTSIVLTPNYSDISNDNTNIIGITGVKSLSNDVSMILNGINYTLPLSRFYYQGKTIPSYIYQNNTWKEFTNTKSYLFKSDYLDDPVLPPMGDLDETRVDNYTHLALLTSEDGTKYMYLQPCKSNYGMDYNRIICSAEKIDFSKYNTVEIELKFVYESSSSTNNMGFGYTVGYSDTFSSRDYDRTFQYGSTVSNSEYPSLKPDVYTTITADISKQSGEYYILFSFGISSFAVFINSICLY